LVQVRQSEIALKNPLRFNTVALGLRFNVRDKPVVCTTG